MRTLSSLAIASQNAENTDEVWLLRLTINHANILDGPLRLVNDMRDALIPPANIIDQRDMTQWTATNATVQLFGGSLFLVADPDATQANIAEGTPGLSSGQTYTSLLFVKKDTVAKTTRYPLIRMSDAGGQSNVYLDTSTGEAALTQSGTGHVASGVIDAGDYWLVYHSRTGATSSTLTLYPAVGANATLGNTSGGATGSCYAYRPTLYQGLIAALQRWIAYPFQIDLPGEDPEQPSVAGLRIDNVDQSIVEAIRGLPSKPMVDLELILASQPEQVEIGFYDLSLRVVDYDALYVEGQMTFEDITTEPITLEMTPSRFPGLFILPWLLAGLSLFPKLLVGGMA